MDGSISSGEIISDRRQSSRLPFESKATITFTGAVYSALTRDLTPEGAFLVTDLLLPDATPVELALDIDDGLAPIDVIGRVVRTEPESPDRSGFAVEFDALEHEDASRILAATRRS